MNDDIAEDYRQLADLIGQIGIERYRALLNPDNKDEVKSLGDKLLLKAGRIILTVGDRTYESCSFLQPGESPIKGREVVGRAIRMNADLGEMEGRYFMDNHTGRRGDVFIFTEWLHQSDPLLVACVYWGSNDSWVLGWNSLKDFWSGNGRLLCRR